MKTGRLWVVLVLLCAGVIPANAQGPCAPDDMEFLAADVLEHFSDAPSETERLNLMFEYLSFATICHEAFDCTDLNTTYAKRLSEAETPDELLLVNLELSTALLYCYDEVPEPGRRHDLPFER